MVAGVADRLGLTRALSTGLAGLKARRRSHDPGRVIRDLAVMLADGGECVADLGAVRDQEPLFGTVGGGEAGCCLVCAPCLIVAVEAAQEVGPSRRQQIVAGEA